MVVTARAKLSKGTASGTDGAPPELYKELPYSLMLDFWKHFNERYNNRDSIQPCTWKLIEFCGIPKDQSETGLEGLRWVGKLDCCFKWYTRCMQPLMQHSLPDSLVCTYGFKIGRSCDDISAVVRQTLFLADRWGLPPVVGTADIATAFDCMTHSSICKCLLRRGMHPQLVRAILREVSGMSGKVFLPGAGLSEPCPFQRGGKQGGVETPEVFNIMMEYALEPSVASWKSRSFGFAFGEVNDSPVRLTHLIWADNIILFATDVAQFETMAQDVTEAVYALGFSWKFNSMECMLCGPLSVAPLSTVPQVFADGPRCFKVVHQMVILGVMYDTSASTGASVEYRLQKGGACFWKHFKTLSGSGSVQSRLRGWSTGPVAAAIYGCNSWHLSKSLLVRLRRWELAFLRKMFKTKWRPGEGRMAYNRRTATLIQGWFESFGVLPLYLRVIDAVFRNSWAERGRLHGALPNFLACCREFRCRAWWESIRDLRGQRVEEGFVHAGKGPRCKWEDVFCVAFGVNWRHCRDRC